MDILKDIVSTITGQQVDYDEVDQENSSTTLGHDDKNLQCEKQIIQCQITNDRLLGSTSKSLRKKYGDDVVNRTIQRLSQRRKRGKCSRKAEINLLAKFFQPVVENYIKKQDERGI